MKTYVISGGTGMGKTTTANALKKAGFYVAPEVARTTLELMGKLEALDSKGKTPHEVERDFLQRAIFMFQEKQLELLPEDKDVIFFDRGFGDTLCFYISDGLEIPKDLLEKAEKIRYDKIFFLEPLKEYKKDEIRCEDEEESKKIGECALRVYSEILGYEVIRVPFMPVQERVRFILGKIKE